MPVIQRLKLLALLFTACMLASGCHDEDDDIIEDDLDPYVDTEAYPIIKEEGSLHLFTFSTFYEDNNNIDNDLMVLHFDNFSPASTNEIPDEDKGEDKTLNDLGWTQDSWDEDKVAWETVSSPKSSDIYSKTRPYRILDAKGLSAPVTALNQPIYEAVDKNVYERQLAATFVWDMGSYTDDTGEDLSGEEIADYETYSIGSQAYELLPNALIWGEDVNFSNGARIYGASRSIAADTLAVEAVEDNNAFSLTPTKFGTGAPSIEDALSAYAPGVNRLEYRFTVDYSIFGKLYISFDTTNDIAYIYNSLSGSVYFEAPYTLHSNPSYVEINTASLSKDERIILGSLPAYFNPIIAGPYTLDGSSSDDISQKSYFYGKHYIKTDEINRLLLEPVFFLNAVAKNDVVNAFKLWRDTRHQEEGK